MRRSPFALLVAVACASPAPAPAPHGAVSPAPVAPTGAEPVPRGQLPSDVRPTHVALSLEVDPSRERFSGEEEIALTLQKPRSVVWLHGRSLQVRAATFVLASGRRVAATYEQVDETGIARLTPEAPLPAGAAVLQLSWDAPFDAQLVGVYRTRAAGQWLAFSKFEAFYARRAFPGFDEPDVKTPFAITLTVPGRLRAISNGPAIEEVAVDGGRKRVRFKETPPLPTYLVAFVVGDVETVDTVVPANEIRATPLPLRGVAVRGNAPKLAFAIGEAKDAIAALEREFAIAFPYDKIDLVAVPDFQSGAMENAGAITFRDQLLLVDAQGASIERRKRVSDTIAHELAHQWFGDLVTMRWWDEIWLNEGFATFMATRIVERIRPEYRSGLDEVRASGRVMTQDELVSTRRIRQPILSTHDITNAFDGITYQKGAAILRMFQRWVGAEKFRDGLREFLREHRNGNATTADLLDALSRAAGCDVRGPFQSFLDQPGVPLVEATVSCTPGAGASLSLKQSRSLPLGSSGSRGEAWQIPICIRSDLGEQCAMLDGPEGAMHLPACPAWLFPNADAAGYYRWALAGKDLANLRQRGRESLSTPERVSFAQNLSSAFASGALPAQDVLAALEPLAGDASGAVAAQPMAIFGFAHDEIADATLRRAVEQTGRALYTPVLGSLGWHGSAAEPADRRELRPDVIRFLSLAMNDPAVRRDAARIGRSAMENGGRAPGGVDDDVLPIALTSASVEDGASFAARATSMLFATEDAELRERLLVAIASTRDDGLLQRALELGFDDRLRQNERALPLFVALQQVETRDRAWEFIERRFDALAPRLPDRYAGFLISALKFCDDGHAQRIRSFFSPRVDRIEGGPRNLASALERIALCKARVDVQGPGVRAFFNGTDRAQPQAPSKAGRSRAAGG